MKKIAVILLIVLFVFNLFGYRLLFYYVQEKADIRLESNFDQNNYNENELIAITVPFSMPYQCNSTQFERFDGEITVNGNIYKYVKRKFSSGQLTVLCIPNHEKMRYKRAMNTIAGNLNGLVQNNTAESNNTISFEYKGISDFDKNEPITFSPICSTLNLKFANLITASITTISLAKPWQPPELS